MTEILTRADIKKIMKWKSDTPIIRLENTHKLRKIANMRPCRYNLDDVNLALFGARKSNARCDDYDPSKW